MSYAVLLAICWMSSVSHSEVVKRKVFLLRCFVEETDRLSIDFWQLLSKRVKVINVFPWLWICFGRLGYMAFLTNNRVFKDPQLPVKLNVY